MGFFDIFTERGAGVVNDWQGTFLGNAAGAANALLEVYGTKEASGSVGLAGDGMTTLSSLATLFGGIGTDTSEAVIPDKNERKAAKAVKWMDIGDGILGLLASGGSMANNIGKLNGDNKVMNWGGIVKGGAGTLRGLLTAGKALYKIFGKPGEDMSKAQKAEQWASAFSGAAGIVSGVAGAASGIQGLNNQNNKTASQVSAWAAGAGALVDLFKAGIGTYAAGQKKPVEQMDSSPPTPNYTEGAN